MTAELTDFDALTVLESAADHIWKTAKNYPASYPTAATDPDSFGALTVLREASKRLWNTTGVTSE